MPTDTKRTIYITGCHKVEPLTDWRQNKERIGLHVLLRARLPSYEEVRFSVDARKVDDIGQVTTVPVHLGQNMQTHVEMIADQICINAQTEKCVYIYTPPGFENQIRQALKEATLPYDMMPEESRFFGNIPPAFPAEKWVIISSYQTTVCFPEL